jgi:hypothetical protein
MKLPRNLGNILMAVWFILFGILSAPLLEFRFAHSGDLLAALAVVVGAIVLFQSR